MSIKEIKEKILTWTDFYGQDISQTDLIKRAKSLDDLKEVMEQHKTFLEDQNNDAISHLEEFMRELELY